MPSRLIVRSLRSDSVSLRRNISTGLGSHKPTACHWFDIDAVDYEPSAIDHLARSTGDVDDDTGLEMFVTGDGQGCV